MVKIYNYTNKKHKKIYKFTNFYCLYICIFLLVFCFCWFLLVFCFLFFIFINFLIRTLKMIQSSGFQYRTKENCFFVC